MVKKLMMNNNYSENGQSPVLNDLICWLDNRDAYENDTVPDRMGLNNFLGSDRNNQYHLNSSIIYSEKSINLNKTYTFCISLKILQIRSYGLIISDKTNPLLFKICNRDNSKIGFYSSYGPTILNEGIPIILNKKTNITIVFDNNSISIYDDFTKITEIATDINITINNPIQLGTIEYNTNRSTFKLYSFKIYNRVLSEEEIYQNYLYEQLIERE